MLSDVASPEPSRAVRDAVSAVMRGNRRSDTRPELAVRSLLHAAGLRYRVDYPLPFDKRRKADILFSRQRLAVFIDGCFWHGCPEHYRPAKTDPDGFWAAKLQQNAARDADTDQRLAECGWTVLRFWEHEDPHAVAARVREEVTLIGQRQHR
jgi:DNA mismatch endonuclease (patch repair protein)